MALWCRKNASLEVVIKIEHDGGYKLPIDYFSKPRLIIKMIWLMIRFQAQLWIHFSFRFMMVHKSLDEDMSQLTIDLPDSNRNGYLMDEGHCSETAPKKRPINRGVSSGWNAEAPSPAAGLYSTRNIGRNISILKIWRGFGTALTVQWI